MLRAIQLINDAKAANPNGSPQGRLSVDLHPGRPEYRGFCIPNVATVSLEADATFEEIEAAGSTVVKSRDAHAVLDGAFVISGEIPRVTPYENGVKFGGAFDTATGKWKQDESIIDERFLMCNVRGKGLVVFTGCSHAGVVNVSRHAAEVGGGVPLYAVMGGFHLVGVEDQVIVDTVEDLKKLQPKLLLPGHCSGWRVKYQINKEIPGSLAPSTVGTKFKI
jgi:7,8-dihydropterin-6-yl-methyl-4-(beta-D-ribofuranosyl)aminobenzene 5'-phosphate synthase